MDIAGLQFWSDKFRTGLGIIFILFIICFVAIVIEESFLGGRRRRKAEKNAREQRVGEGRNDSATSDRAQQN
jgi:hypothetical protein